jgi:hypothetical protein
MNIQTGKDMIGILIENANVSLFLSLPFSLLGHAYVCCVSTSAESLLCGYVVIGGVRFEHISLVIVLEHISAPRDSSAFRQSKRDNLGEL